MKKIIYILFLAVLCAASNAKKIFIEKIAIGKFNYSIYKESMYLHDEEWNADFFRVYLKNSKNCSCSSFMSADRNDSVFTKGSYSYTKNALVFKEYYFFKNRDFSDSMHKKFFPDKSGKLKLTEFVYYKDGKVKPHN